MSYLRTAKVAEAIKEEVSIIISKLKDPRIKMVTITGVDVSPDLRNATIFISVIDFSKKESTLNVLKKAKGYIKAELGKKLRMKYMPDLDFKWDESIEQGLKISKILNQMHEEESENKE